MCAVLAASTGEHLSAADVHRLANEAGPSVDQSTVYRTLETLEEAGLVTHTHMGHQPLVYHLAEVTAHQHLICVSCGTTDAMPESQLEEFFAEITRRTGFVPDATHVALSGRCSRCQAAAEAPSGDN